MEDPSDMEIQSGVSNEQPYERRNNSDESEDDMETNEGEIGNGNGNETNNGQRNQNNQINHNLRSIITVECLRMNESKFHGIKVQTCPLVS